VESGGTHRSVKAAKKCGELWDSRRIPGVWGSLLENKGVPGSKGK